MFEQVNILKLQKQDKIFLLLLAFAMCIGTYTAMRFLWHKPGQTIQPVVERLASEVEKYLNESYQELQAGADRFNDTIRKAHNFILFCKNKWDKAMNNKIALFVTATALYVILLALSVSICIWIFKKIQP